jgi:hypothetical protein
MIRLLGVSLVALMSVWGAARADSVTQRLLVRQKTADGGLYAISGDSFDTALGTLESVTATLSANDQAGIYVPEATGLPPSISTFILGSLFAGTADGFTGRQFAPVMLTLDGDEYVSDTTHFSVHNYSFPELAAFLGNGGPESDLLAFDFWSPLGLADVGAVDASRFYGTLYLTYNYIPAPEPSALAVFGVGALLVALAHAASAQAARRHRQE